MCIRDSPKNTARGLSTVMAFGVLAEVATGLPLLISELTLTTALRTAATSAVAARALARPNSRVMALIGNGAQSEFQALAFHHLVGIDEIRLFDVDADATAKLMRNLHNNPDAAQPVSYTHLDVYKRQGQRFTLANGVFDTLERANILGQRVMHQHLGLSFGLQSVEHALHPQHLPGQHGF